MSGSEQASRLLALAPLLLIPMCAQPTVHVLPSTPVVAACRTQGGLYNSDVRVTFKVPGAGTYRVHYERSIPHPADEYGGPYGFQAAGTIIAIANLRPVSLETFDRSTDPDSWRLTGRWSALIVPPYCTYTVAAP